MKDILEKLADIIADGTDNHSKTGVKENADESPESVSDKPETQGKQPETSQPIQDKGGPVAGGGAIDGQAVIEFFAANPHPADDKFHAFCEQSGYDTHEAETIAYSLATLMVQFIKGGKFAASGQTYDQLDQEQLQNGIDVESEHCDIPEIQIRIAADHLIENPLYYTYLAEMEALMSEDKGGSQGGEQIPPDQIAAEPDSNLQENSNPSSQMDNTNQGTIQ